MITYNNNKINFITDTFCQPEIYYKDPSDIFDLNVCVQLGPHKYLSLIHI